LLNQVIGWLKKLLDCLSLRNEVIIIKQFDASISSLWKILNIDAC